MGPQNDNDEGRKPCRVQSARLLQLKTQRELQDYDRVTQNVPSTLGSAARVFFSRPSIVVSMATSLVIGFIRLQIPWTISDPFVMLTVTLWWLFQEWFIHAKLLHSVFDWWGRDVHIVHHSMPYHHISIDGMKLVVSFMLAAFSVFFIIFQENLSLLLTATLTYYCMGLSYEWTHFLVHTRVRMDSYVGQIIKRAHVKHHLRDHHFWFSFTCPPIDNLMGTTPNFFLVG
eukprot:TRINITY_DN15477_c0_g1_i1.p1 TRINITY_DN15477_c0_g1~~TRINITY_DN15477_c0_g1_i1.p1  ORF type:complete len:229 (-),score=10.48 TRINITY_DN15477_c0_g1_i1:268-954(-)